MSESKGLVVKSRFTPDLVDATDVGLREGDVCSCRRIDGDGPTLKITLTTGLRQDKHTGRYGYEARFHRNDKVYFVDEREIIDWEGKRQMANAKHLIDQTMSDNEKPPGLTVGQLRAALAGLPDDMTVTVRASNAEMDSICGGITCVFVEHAHDEDDTEHLCIDASDDPEEF